MAETDLRKRVLYLKVLKMIKDHWQCRVRKEAGAHWRRMILPN